MKTETKQTHMPTADSVGFGYGDIVVFEMSDGSTRLVKSSLAIAAPELLAIVRMVSEFFEHNTPVSRGTLLNYGDSETATLGLAVRQAIAKAEARA